MIKKVFSLVFVPVAFIVLTSTVAHAAIVSRYHPADTDKNFQISFAENDAYYRSNANILDKLILAQLAVQFLNATSANLERYYYWDVTQTWKMTSEKPVGEASTSPSPTQTSTVSRYHPADTDKSFDFSSTEWDVYYRSNASTLDKLTLLQIYLQMFRAQAAGLQLYYYWDVTNTWKTTTTIPIGEVGVTPVLPSTQAPIVSRYHIADTDKNFQISFSEYDTYYRSDASFVDKGILLQLYQNLFRAASTGQQYYYYYDVTGTWKITTTKPVAEVDVTRVSSITVLTPNGGETWPLKSEQLIQWKSTYSPCPTGQICVLGYPTKPVPVDLYLIQYMPPCTGPAVCPLYAPAPRLIAKDVITSYYKWTVGRILNSLDSVQPGSYLITVCSNGSSYGDKTNCDSSDSYFKISDSATSPGISVTSPNGGETWPLKSERFIQWKGAISSCPVGQNCIAGFPTKPVDLYLTQYTPPCTGTICPLAPVIAPYTIARNVSASSFKWSVGTILDAGRIVWPGNYLITACYSGSQFGDKTNCDSSNSYFKISDSIVAIPVDLKQEVTGVTAGAAFVRLSIAGFPTNTQINRWVLGITCDSGISVLGKNNENLCGQNLTTYRANMYDPTSDYVILTSGVQNKGSVSGNAYFKLEAYNANNQSIGGDKEFVSVTSASTLPGTPSITSVSSKGGSEGEIYAGTPVYISGVSLLGGADTSYRTTIYIGNSVCPITGGNDNQLTCTASSNLVAGNKYDLYITKDGRTSNRVPVIVLSTVAPTPTVSLVPTFSYDQDGIIHRLFIKFGANGGKIYSIKQVSPAGTCYTLAQSVAVPSKPAYAEIPTCSLTGLTHVGPATCGIYLQKTVTQSQPCQVDVEYAGGLTTRVTRFESYLPVGASVNTGERIREVSTNSAGVSPAEQLANILKSLQSIMNALPSVSN